MPELSQQTLWLDPDVHRTKVTQKEAVPAAMPRNLLLGGLSHNCVKAADFKVVGPTGHLLLCIKDIFKDSIIIASHDTLWISDLMYIS